jgi:rubrerythrin
MKIFTKLTEPEILALAITSEEEDSQIYLSFANRLRTDYPSTAQMFDDMAAEEQTHKNMLLDVFQKRFGGRLPYITRQDVRGFMKRNPIWLMENMRIEEVRQQAELMEVEASTFYSKAALLAQDVEVRKLLGDLAIAEQGHEAKAIEIERKNLSESDKASEAEVSHRIFVLQVVQPGLAGLIDGSISTLAPIFAAAFATHNSHDAFLVGLAASVGAGISMGITEAMSDDGAITGRGSPWTRGIVCGLMTTIGGLGHTLPYLIPDFWTATLTAALIVAIELAVISWIRWKYMETPIISALVQVLFGGALVLLVGILIGNA